jgi:hypothetical protein
MRTIGVLFLGLLALAAAQGCKHKRPEPIPGPKAGTPVARQFRPAGIAWFQGSLEEAFAPTTYEQVEMSAYRRAEEPADVRTEARPEARQPTARIQPAASTVGQSCPTRRVHG